MEYDEKKIKQILQNAKTIAVVGLSRKPHRDSYRVAEYLQQSGYRIIPVNPSLREEVLGEKPYPNLSAVPIPIDIVNIFRKSEDVPPIVEEALSLAPQCIWMQMGIENPAAAAKARAQGIWVVMNHCLMVEHKKILNH